jgi:hypothetical protein
VRADSMVEQSVVVMVDSMAQHLVGEKVATLAE